jgi:hypothetical protein
VKIFYKISYLSLDVVLGALATCYLLSLWFNVQLELDWYFMLGSAVWIVYTIDHLIDSKLRDAKFLPERHIFHKDNFLVLALIVLFLGIATLIDGLKMLDLYQWELLGIELIVMAAYFAMNIIFKTRFLVKELFIAVLYTVGVSFPFIALYQVQIQVNDIFFLALIFFTAWMNLLAFAKISVDEDKISGFKSIALVLSEYGLRLVFTISLLIYFGLFIINAFLNGDIKLYYVMIYTCVGLVQIMIFTFSDTETNLRLLRIIGDVAFSLPLSLLFF